MDDDKKTWPQDKELVVTANPVRKQPGYFHVGICQARETRAWKRGGKTQMWFAGPEKVRGAEWWRPLCS